MDGLIARARTRKEPDRNRTDRPARDKMPLLASADKSAGDSASSKKPKYQASHASKGGGEYSDGGSNGNCRLAESTAYPAK